MTFRNIRLLFRREMIDQFRDRRTLLMIFVVPILLYPLLGLLFLQTAQFLQDKPSRVLVLTSEEQKVLGLPESAKLEYFFESNESAANEEEVARNAIAKGETDAVLLISPDLQDLGKSEEQAECLNKFGDESPVLTLKIVYSSASENSVLASSRLEKVLQDWDRSLGMAALEKRGIDPDLLHPLTIQTQDITAQSVYEGASFWSKILPVMLLLWALTGAFYPAVDLCAGEKERGTLETLLCSPATRGEIVLGKLLTITSFSVLGAILNLFCISLTGSFLAVQIPGVLAPPFLPTLGLLIPLLPVSLTFSAICLALASLAKSTKEGQYYLLPVMMTTLPLVFLSLAPGCELTLGTALIPITGLSLILRNWLEGNLELVFRFLPVVLTITLLCCFFTIRFAVAQFKKESLLFSDSRKFNPRLWFHELFSKHQAYPTFSAALFCAVLILVLKYFLSFAFSEMNGFAFFFLATLSLQVGVIALPPIVLAFFGTTHFWGTLGFAQNGQAVSQTLKNCLWAGLGAVLLHPALLFVAKLISILYPLSEVQQQMIEQLTRLMENVPFPFLLVLFALVPAVCEEIAFRGYILNGLLQNKPKTIGTHFDAIVLSAFFFGVTHSLLQQSLSAAVIGCLLGYIAIRAGQIWPCIVFHFIHNALAISLPQLGWTFHTSLAFSLIVFVPGLFFLRQITKTCTVSGEAENKGDSPPCPRASM